MSSESKLTLLASYIVAFNVAKKNCSFVDEQFIHYCMLQINVVSSEVLKFTNIRLSNNTRMREIEDIGDDLELQLDNLLNRFTHFFIMLDESTDLQNEFMPGKRIPCLS